MCKAAFSLQRCCARKRDFRFLHSPFYLGIREGPAGIAYQNSSCMEKKLILVLEEAELAQSLLYNPISIQSLQRTLITKKPVSKTRKSSRPARSCLSKTDSQPEMGRWKPWLLLPAVGPRACGLPHLRPKSEEFSLCRSFRRRKYLRHFCGWQLKGLCKCSPTCDADRCQSFS